MHAGWLRNRARRYYDDEKDAEDLASETIFKCLCQTRRFDNDRKFKPWAQTVMENIYINQYNRRKCVLFTGYDYAESYKSCDHTDQLASIHNLMSIVRHCSRRSRCIESVMLYARGFNYDEIAKLLMIPSGTVKSRVAAGRKMLRELLS